MITIRPGSHVHTLLTVLSFVGEYPVTALGLFGSVRSYKDLIYKLSMPQEFRFPDREKRFHCRLLTISGKGKRKTIRLHKSALTLLRCWDEDAYENYMMDFDDHTFSGNSRHVERNHLVAEVAVMCMKAGIEANPLYTPEVMEEQVRSLRVGKPYFYFSRELKRVNQYEMNKIRFMEATPFGEFKWTVTLNEDGTAVVAQPENEQMGNPSWTAVWTDNGDGTFTTAECTGEGPMIAAFWNNNAITWVNNGDGTVTPVGYTG